MSEMLTSKTEFIAEPKKAAPSKPTKKSDVTMLVEGEISRDQERWRVAVTDAVSTKSMPPSAVIARLGIAWGVTDPSEASRLFAEDMKTMKSHRAAVVSAANSAKKKAAWLKEHGCREDLEQQVKSLEESLKAVKTFLHEYHRLESTGAEWRPGIIEKQCGRMFPTQTAT